MTGQKQWCVAAVIDGFDGAGLTCQKQRHETRIPHTVQGRVASVVLHFGAQSGVLQKQLSHSALLAFTGDGVVQRRFACDVWKTPQNDVGGRERRKDRGVGTVLRFDVDVCTALQQILHDTRMSRRTGLNDNTSVLEIAKLRGC